MTSPPEHDPAEPRFAGSVAWVPAESSPPAVEMPAPSPPPPPLPPTAPPASWSSQPLPPFDYATQYGTSYYPPNQAEAAPVVAYGPGLEGPADDDLAPGAYVSPAWLPGALAILGGLIAGIGSLLTWATLELASQGADASAGGDNVSSIDYNGLSLLEGRIALVFGVAAIVLGIVSLLGRLREGLLASCLCLLGAVGLVVAGFAAIGHPVELSTLFRSYRQIDSVKVSLPDGVGVWFALAGALLILVGGLLARMNQTAAEDPAAAGADRVSQPPM